MRNLFTEHPNLSGETYAEHGKFAVWAGVQMIGAGIACIIHACFPFLFQFTASNMMIPLAKKLSDRKQALKEVK